MDRRSEAGLAQDLALVTERKRYAGGDEARFFSGTKRPSSTGRISS
jgi:hypothetical protein